MISTFVPVYFKWHLHLHNKMWPSCFRFVLQPVSDLSTNPGWPANVVFDPRTSHEHIAYIGVSENRNFVIPSWLTQCMVVQYDVRRRCLIRICSSLQMFRNCFDLLQEGQQWLAIEYPENDDDEDNAWPVHLFDTSTFLPHFSFSGLIHVIGETPDCYDKFRACYSVDQSLLSLVFLSKYSYKSDEPNVLTVRIPASHQHQCVPTLRQICRAVIVKNTPSKLLDLLNIPKALIDYVCGKWGPWVNLSCL